MGRRDGSVQVDGLPPVRDELLAGGLGGVGRDDPPVTGVLGDRRLDVPMALGRGARSAVKATRAFGGGACVESR
jgi:hypothetical protein